MIHRFFQNSAKHLRWPVFIWQSSEYSSVLIFFIWYRKIDLSCSGLLRVFDNNTMILRTKTVMSHCFSSCFSSSFFLHVIGFLILSWTIHLHRFCYTEKMSKVSWTSFMPLASFYIPWKHQKTRGFQMFSGDTEKD